MTELWRASAAEFDEFFAISREYELCVLRNPDAGAWAVEHRHKHRVLVASFIEEVANRSDMTLRLPERTLAASVEAAGDWLTYSAWVNGEDLFAPFLDFLNAALVADTREPAGVNTTRSNGADSEVA